MCNDEDILKNINSLDKNKPSTFKNIPAKILLETSDICVPFLKTIYNNSKYRSNFPDSLKYAEISPIYKKGENTKKENYRPISILPCISKLFERDMYNQKYSYMDQHLSPHLCGFRKGYSAQHCLALMLEKWKKALDNHQVAGALLTDLSKAFDCLNHHLLIAKLEAYGFDNKSLRFIHSYLSARKQRTKINNVFSSWSDIISGVPQGSIIGPLLFNIYLNDIFLFIQGDSLTNYADDNTPFSVELNAEAVLNSLKTSTSILIKWFKNNYFKMNAKKCQLIVTNHDNDLNTIIDSTTIIGSSSVKLLGIKIDSKLNFNEHVTDICKKVSLKIHALARISRFVNKSKLRKIVKAFIESQFGYCPLIWMFHSRTLNNRINRLHERALRLIYRNLNLTFQEMLFIDNSFTIHERNLQKLVTEIYKCKNNYSPIFMTKIFPGITNSFNLRSKNTIKTYNVHSVHNGTETISFRGPKLWANLPTCIKNSKSLTEFKRQIKMWKPKGCSCRLCKSYIANVGFI